MGWSDCGKDSRGRRIGYGYAATCDHPGCTTKIDRGLSYACGGMHGENGVDCEGYFCTAHLGTYVLEEDGHAVVVCGGCRATLDLLVADGEFGYDEQDDEYFRIDSEAGREKLKKIAQRDA